MSGAIATRSRVPARVSSRAMPSRASKQASKRGGFTQIATDRAHVSMSYVERSNLTLRMMNRRFARLTNAFSKKIENHMHATALFVFHYNFYRLQKTIRCTPAMEAGVSDHIWEIEEFVGLLG
jgi:hypothetical protein